MEEDRKKHLDLIQAVIARLGNNGFLIKGWTVALTSAILGFAAKDLTWELAAVALAPVLLFWGLDGYFLMLERHFRSLYDRVRVADEAAFKGNPFAIAPDAYPKVGDPSPSRAITWTSCLRRPAVAGLHFPLLVVVIAAGLYLGFVKEAKPDVVTPRATADGRWESHLTRSQVEVRYHHRQHHR